MSEPPPPPAPPPTPAAEKSVVEEGWFWGVVIALACLSCAGTSLYFVLWSDSIDAAAVVEAIEREKREKVELLTAKYRGNTPAGACVCMGLCLCLLHRSSTESETDSKR